MCTRGSLQATLLFHLNLSYSAIERDERPEVVRRCYRPLLDLLERLPWLKLAVEASGHTFERMEVLDPEWIERLAEYAGSGRVEIVGSGDTQLIGPLVPAEVNRWNQELGQETYERLFGRRATTALVNEMAFSQGVVDAYLDAGYEALVTEWNNPRQNHPEWDDDWRYRLGRTASPTGRRIALHWTDTILFQKFQRVVMGELALPEYRAWMRRAANGQPRHVFVYANDAEVFDWRPGRYRTEPKLKDGASEWARMVDVVEALRDDGLDFVRPVDARTLPDLRAEADVRLSSGADPIPVKKQPKYNVTRWALSGRDDPGLNARCFAEARRLTAREAEPEAWRRLCRAWASDLRTHLTDKRWEDVQAHLPAPAPAPERQEGARLEHVAVDQSRERITIETDDVRLRLVPRRGLAIEELGFPSVADSLAVTLPHGYFDEIAWGADFYSGNTTILRPGHALVTDLEDCTPTLERYADHVAVATEVPTQLGRLPKIWRVYGDRVELELGLAALGTRPACSLHAGTITLDPETFGPNLVIQTNNGGARESFPLVECDHTAGISPLVSSAAAFGATTGELSIGDGERELILSWPSEGVAALPMFTLKRIGERRFLRCVFSLSELDETFREEASLHDFRLTIRARRTA